MAQHAFWRENDQRLAPRTARLPAQHVEILRRCGRLTNLHVVFGSQLQEALEAGARMLRALAFVTVGQQHHDSCRKIPFILACADELVDDHLRAVGEIAELCLPKNESLGVVAAKAVFKAEAACFGKRGIVDFAERLIRRKVTKGKIVLLRLSINQHGVALIERAALRVLAGEANGRAFKQQGAKSQRFGKTIIDSTLPMPHFGALLEQLHNFWMNVKALRHANKA